MRETQELADEALKAAMQSILEQALCAEIYDLDANVFGLGMNLDLLLSPR